MIFHRGHRNPHGRAPVTWKGGAGGCVEYSGGESSEVFSSKWAVKATIALLREIYRVRKSHSWVVSALNGAYGHHNWSSEVCLLRSEQLGEKRVEVTARIAIVLADSTRVEEEVVVRGDYRRAKQEAGRRALRACLFRLVELYEETVELAS